MLVMGTLLATSEQKVVSKRCTCNDNSNYDMGDYMDSASDILDSAGGVVDTAGDVLGDVLGIFVVGPRKWLRKLTYEEQQEIRQKCTPVNPVQDRILHGTFAKQGQFKHMAVLTHSDGSGGEMTLCTGTLITRRHIVTARHCFHTTEQTDSFPLKVGGVCHSIGEDGCNEIDMKELEYDFAIFDNNSTLKSEADISIIQLKKDVSDDLLESGNVSIACLPWSTLIETPTNMTLHGWGRIEGEQHAKHLRYGFANFSKYNDYSLVAYSNTSKGQVGADHGDSGSGVVAFNDKLNDYLLWGLTIKADNITGSSSEHITLLLNLSEYYEDLCFYIGLCPGSVEGLMPKLNMGGMYWHDIGARPEFATTQYFRPISDEANQNYWRKCNDTRFAYINGTFFHPNDENLIATAITDQHFITTKECFRKNIEANNLVNGTSNLTIQTSPTCYGDVEFVAWSYTHPLAIIQLVINLIQVPRTKIIVSVSPYAIKLETWLRINNLNYVNVSNEFSKASSKEQIPFIEVNGRQFADTNIIIDKLKDMYNLTIDQNLNSIEKAKARAIIVLIEESLFRCYVYNLSQNISWLASAARSFEMSLKYFLLIAVLAVGLVNADLNTDNDSFNRHFQARRNRQHNSRLGFESLTEPAADFAGSALETASLNAGAKCYDSRLTTMRYRSTFRRTLELEI
uniref:Peptidase S1 domain-containing protein n=1 Tax=Ditylenchus dipsaci TaxID=166011 RepID=A0A915E5F1_9BILA